MSARLYSLSLSHPSLASRLALERKGIEHRVVELLPGMHPLALRALGFEAPTVPALKIGGERVQGSLRIARYLEELRPEPSLYPAEPQRRTRAEEAERWGEAELQPVPRRIFRYGATHDQRVRRWLAEEIGMPLPGLTALLNKPVAYVMGRRAGAGAERVRNDVVGLGGLLDHADALIAEGTIGGPDLNAADFQILSSVRSIESFADLAPMLAGRPVGQAAKRIPALPGPVPPSLPEQWLGKAQAVA